MPTRPGAIAIVDDDASVLRSLERTLKVSGYRTMTFASAEQYLDEVDNGDVACAVIDLQLGDGISGLDLGKAIAVVHETPVVFMTGSADSSLHRCARAVGCDFLEKPFGTERLLEAIAKLDVEGS